MSAEHDALAEVGRLAVAFITARRERMAARRNRTAAAVAFYEAHGGDAAYSVESDHPQGFSAEFLAATEPQQAAYRVALNAEKSHRQRLYRAVSRVGGAARD